MFRHTDVCGLDVCMHTMSTLTSLVKSMVILESYDAFFLSDRGEGELEPGMGGGKHEKHEKHGGRPEEARLWFLVASIDPDSHTLRGSG